MIRSESLWYVFSGQAWWSGDVDRTTPEGSCRFRRSAAGHAHVARDGRLARVPVDDEDVTPGLAQHRLVDRTVDEVVALGGAQRRAQIGGILLAEAHIERAGAGQPHPIARL